MYSNCLFEAIKAKIKDPKNIHIHHFPISLNNNYLHFYWVDDRDNAILHYENPNAGKYWFSRFSLLFNGRLKRHQRDLFERKLYKKMTNLGWSFRKQVRIAKKLGFKWLNPNELLEN